MTRAVEVRKGGNRGNLEEVVAEQSASMCSSAGSHAKTFPTPASVPVWTGPGPDSGLSISDALASFVHGSWLSRTSEASLFGESIKFSEDWPTQGMTRNGRLFARPMLAHPIAEPACSSSHWATPRNCSAMGADITDEAIAVAHLRFPNLESQIALEIRQEWATPSSTDFKGSVTPAAAAAAQAELSPRGVRLPEQITKLDGLPDQANLNTTGNRPASSPRPVLNPRWVACLMGFPADYLDGVEPPSRRSGTRSCQPSPELSPCA